MDYNPFKHKFSEMNTQEIAPGNILIAEPFMQDPYFKRSVVLLTDHNPDGTVGFILNSPLGIQLSELVDAVINFDAPVYLGGPVQPQNLFFIHSLGALIPDSVKISEGLYWDGDFEAVKTLAALGKLDECNIRFFLGYSGWDLEQLAQEIDSQPWLISQTSNERLLDTYTEYLWKDALEEMGKEQAILATFPEDPNLN